MDVVRTITTSIFALLLSLAAVSPAVAGCVSSLVQAATRHGVPPDLMLAIGHAESGWNAFAVNSAGDSHFPETAAAAVALVQDEQARGVVSIDVGCGQINLRWHEDAFGDLVEAFDPKSNAEYAAGFLAELKAAHGNWPTAVAHYHSNDPEAQQAYLERVTQRLAVLQDGAPPGYFSTRPIVAAAPGGDEPPELAEPAIGSVQPRIIGVGPLPQGDAGGRIISVPRLQ